MFSTIWTLAAVCILFNIVNNNFYILWYSWHFFPYSAPIYWLVHGHMTSNNETVYRQMPWGINIAKTMTSNRKQFTVTTKCWRLLHMIRVQLKLAWHVAGISKCFPKFPFVFIIYRTVGLIHLFCYITNCLMTGPLGNSEFCLLRISMFPKTKSRETMRFSGNKITVPQGTSY